MPPRGKKRAPEDDAEADAEKPKAKAKRTAKPKDPVEVSPELRDFWGTHGDSLLYRCKDRDASGKISTFPPGKKIAAFDFDDTLVAKKSNARFATSADDWKPFSKKVNKVLSDFHAQGYKIVVFSNQKGVGKALAGKASSNARQRAENFITEMKLPEITVLMATAEDEFRKPNRGMWDFFVESLNGGVAPDLSQSFFVGDAAGRKLDFSDSDKVFAEAVGIDFKTPEEVFGEGPKKELGGRAPVADGPNAAMAAAFRDLANMQEANGDTWPSRASRGAAEAIANYPDPIKEGKELKSIKGVGKGTIAKIDEFIKTGTLSGLGGGGSGGGGGGGAGGAGAGGSGAQMDADREMAANFL